MNVSLILSTYNSPVWLEKVLWGYENQNFKDFEIVIADDGSGEETKQLIGRFINLTDLKIKHCWHEDNGFQKCKILNQATEQSSGDYLIFSDGDCVPCPDFIGTHMRHAEEGYFISGGYCKLPMSLSKLIRKKDIESGRAFDVVWLQKHGLKSMSSSLKLGLSSPWNTLADILTPTKATWNGCNASTWRKNILEINGHDELMQYGGEDREMGERLQNNGIKSKQLRHRAVLIHLDHARGYVNQDALEKNAIIRKRTIMNKSTWTANGIIKRAGRP